MSLRKTKTCNDSGATLLRCTTCDKWLPDNLFTKHTRAATGKNNQCRDCQKWRMKLRNYGITKQQYEELMHSQGGVCAVCKCKPDDPRCTHGHLVVDHCHKTGYVRGLLCSLCNATMGNSMDSVELLKSLIAYIQRPPASGMAIKP